MTLNMKSPEEVFAFLSEIIHRHRRRYIRKYLRPSPDNCSEALLKGNRVYGCKQCGSHNPEKCVRPEEFTPIYTKQELAEEFKQLLREPEVLLRDYRDITTLLWVLGHFDEKKDTPEALIAKAEKRQEEPQ